MRTASVALDDFGFQRVPFAVRRRLGHHVEVRRRQQAASVYDLSRVHCLASELNLPGKLFPCALFPGCDLGFFYAVDLCDLSRRPPRHTIPHVSHDTLEHKPGFILQRLMS